MNTLFHAKLSEREFSSHLLHVADLLAWAESKRLHLRTSPALDGFEFVQVEALLCAIECQSQDLTRDQAAEIVANNPALKNERMAKLNPAWLLGADAHKKWRELLSGAIERHELTLLDFASKLPIDTAPATDTAKPAKEPTITRQDRRLKACIDAGLSFEQYKGRLPDGVGKVADLEGVSRQTFSDDIKDALKRMQRLASAKGEGVAVRRI